MRGLLKVAGAMAALRRLIEEHSVAKLFETRRHLAGVSRMHAIIACRGPQENRWIGLPRLGEMIGRDLLEEGPVVGFVRIAVYGDPARAREQLAVATHVEQRDRAPDRAEPLRVAREHVADQEPAIAAAMAGKPLRAGDAAAHEISCNCGEVVLRALLVLPDTGIVPGGAKLAAAADIGNHIDAAVLEPSLADICVIARKQRNEKAAVSIENCRRAAVEREIFRANLKVGNAHTVVGKRFVLCDGQSGRIKARWRLLDQVRRLPGCDNAE